MLGSSRGALIQRVSDVAKAVNRTEFKAIKQKSWRPAIDVTAVEATVQFVTHFKWPAYYVQHTIESTCATLAHAPLRSSSESVIKNFCHHLNGSQPPMVPTAALTAQCYNNLLPLVAKYQGLHSVGRQLVEQMLEYCVPVSQAVEQSLPVLYASDHTALLVVIDRARKVGHKPTRRLYRETVKLCMGASEGWRECPPAVRLLVQQLSEDWGKEEGEAVVYSSAFQTARNTPEVEAILTDMLRSGLKMNKEVSQQLLKACGRAMRESPSYMKRVGASVLTRYLVPQGVPVTLRDFEGILTGCQEGLKLAKAVNVFRCMTRTYQIAPSRKAYKAVTNLLCWSAPHPKRRKKIITLCYQTLQDASAAYGGCPPFWVYTEMAIPLLIVMGMKGCHQIYKLCKEAAAVAHQYTGSSTTPEAVWGRPVYHRLLKVASKDIMLKRHRNLSLSLFEDMKCKGIKPNRNTFIHLFPCAQEEDLMYVFSQMAHLPRRYLQTELWDDELPKTFKRIYYKHHINWSDQEKLVQTAVRTLIGVLDRSSPLICIERMALHSDTASKAAKQAILAAAL